MEDVPGALRFTKDLAGPMRLLAAGAKPWQADVPSPREGWTGRRGAGASHPW